MPAWDVCILHTLEDGMTVALPLRHALQQRGYRVLLSDSALESGASIREAVEHGLASCHYAVLVVSKAFLAQAWPQTELDSLLDIAVDGHKAVISVWSGVEADEVQRRLPLVVGRLAVSLAWGLETVAGEIAEVLGPPEGEPAEEEPESPAALQDSDTDFETFVVLGRSGAAGDVDALMSELEAAQTIGRTKVVDYALEQVASHQGRERIEHYLFNGTQRQRNYAALYLKRRGRRRILNKAVKAGCVDHEQAFSR